MNGRNAPCRKIGIGIILVVILPKVMWNSVMRSPSKQPRIIQLLYFGSGFILIWHQDETLARSHQPAPAARWLPKGDVAKQGKRSGPSALRPEEGKMLTADTPQFDGPEVIDRRRLLTAAAATTAASIVPKVTTAEGVCEAIRSCSLPPRVRSPKVTATTARRLLEIHRRNELRREAQLPVLRIAKELRRMKEQEELEAFRRFEAANGQAVWKQVLEARQQREYDLTWRPNWMEGFHYQNQVNAVLRARFGAKREGA
jgi:hypothetical protein